MISPLTEGNPPVASPTSEELAAGQQAGLFGAFNAFLISVNPIYALISSISGKSLLDVGKDSVGVVDAVKKDIGKTLIDVSTVVLGVLALILALYVAVGESSIDKIVSVLKAKDS